MTSSPPGIARYVPYREIGDRSNVIVDGAPLASTVMTLSHWPNNQTPESLKRDTSTAIVFAYIDAPELHRQVEIVSNNHFDEDGLLSMFTFCYPDVALRHRALMLDAAKAGDFGVYTDRDAARLCFTIEAFSDPTVSPLSKKVFSGCENQRVSALYQHMLKRLPELLEDLHSYSNLWMEQDAHLDASERMVADGTVRIEEIAESDLAIVHIPSTLPSRPVRRYLQTEVVPVHPFAIHNATDCSRIIRVQGERLDFQYRYESWLQYVSRRPPLRVDLQKLCERLNSLEAAAGIWRCEKVTEVIPRLYLEGTDRSAISAERFIAEIRQYLATEPVAWDPYDWHGR